MMREREWEKPISQQNDVGSTLQEETSSGTRIRRHTLGAQGTPR
jgi:hypothetical protein